ncbi:MAG: hypothetical protein ACRD5H_16745, partial [Nitrososphaerales archaeon]
LPIESEGPAGGSSAGALRLQKMLRPVLGAKLTTDASCGNPDPEELHEKEFITFDDFRSGAELFKDATRMSDVVALLRDAPWNAARDATVAAWLEQVAESLDSLIDHMNASSVIKNGDNGKLQSCNFDYKLLRAVGNALLCRGFLRLEQDDMGGSWQDIYAVFGLATHIANVGTPLSLGVAKWLWGGCARGATAILSSGKYTWELGQRIGNDLKNAPDLIAVEDVIAMAKNTAIGSAFTTSRRGELERDQLLDVTIVISTIEELCDGLGKRGFASWCGEGQKATDELVRSCERTIEERTQKEVSAIARLFESDRAAKRGRSVALGCVFVRLVIGGYDLRNWYGRDALRNSIIAGVAIADHEKKTHRLPDALKDILGEQYRNDAYSG